MLFLLGTTVQTPIMGVLSLVPALVLVAIIYFIWRKAEII